MGLETSPNRQQLMRARRPGETARGCGQRVGGGDGAAPRQGGARLEDGRVLGTEGGLNLQGQLGSCCRSARRVRACALSVYGF